MSSDWQAEVADGLSPQEVSAGLVTGSLRTSDLPDIAAWWLAEGRDTPSLSELGAAPTDDPWTLDALWERLSEEVGIERLGDEAAARIDMRRILAAWDARRESTIEVLREFDLMGLYRFDSLDVTGGLLDEIDGRWGRTTNEVLADAEVRFRDLLQDLGPRPTWPALP